MAPPKRVVRELAKYISTQGRLVTLELVATPTRVHYEVADHEPQPGNVGDPPAYYTARLQFDKYADARTRFTELCELAGEITIRTAKGITP